MCQGILIVRGVQRSRPLASRSEQRLLLDAQIGKRVTKERRAHIPDIARWRPLLTNLQFVPLHGLSDLLLQLFSFGWRQCLQIVLQRSCYKFLGKHDFLSLLVLLPRDFHERVDLLFEQGSPLAHLVFDQIVRHVPQEGLQVLPLEEVELGFGRFDNGREIAKTKRIVCKQLCRLIRSLFEIVVAIALKELFLEELEQTFAEDFLKADDLIIGEKCDFS